MKKKLLKILIIVIIISLIIAIGVVLKREVSQLNNSIIYINSNKINLNKNSESIELNLETLNSEKETIIKYESGYAKIKINGQELLKEQELNIGMIEIDDESKIEIEVEYKDGTIKKYIVNSLHEKFSEYDVQGESKYDGDYYMTTYSFNYNDNHFIFKIDKKGKIKYYKKTNKVSFDFRKEIDEDGTIKYMYLEATDDNFAGLSSLLPCDLVIMDENYNELERVNYLLEDGTTIPLENHSYKYLGKNHYILTSCKPVKKEAIISSKTETVFVMSSIIQEIKDGKILWEFDSTEYPEFYEMSTLSGLSYTEKYQDYMHINSMDIDKNDGNLICSYRNIDCVIKIDRKSGKILWKLGGKGDEFMLKEEQKFSKQHSAISVDDNTIMIYDNGNSNSRSRVLKIKLNEKDKKVEEFTEYDTGIYAYMMGSVRTIDEASQTYLICYGGGYYTKYSVEEINYLENNVEFKFTFTNKRMMYNANKIK